MTEQDAANVKVGQRVMCNGHDGNISHVCTGQLKGMVEVRLDRGGVCVALDDIGLYPWTENTRIEAA